jgi:hypothetical protein|nr:MAG TPA: hypothetical protein [Caudoviricetes sp.]
MAKVVPINKKERKLWKKWERQGFSERQRRSFLNQERRFQRKMEERKARLPELYKQGKASAEELLLYYEETDPKTQRANDIFVACILAIPVLLIVLVVFFFVSQPMILMCICWAIGMLLAMAFGR